MRISTARVTNYRSVIDSTEFTVEREKTILVGINESGKTALLKGLQHVSPPAETPGLDPLTDFPRSELNKLIKGRRSHGDVQIAHVTFDLEDDDRQALPGHLTLDEDAAFSITVYLDGHRDYDLRGFPAGPTMGEIRDDLVRLKAHVAKESGSDEVQALLDELINAGRHARLDDALRDDLEKVLVNSLPFVDEGDDRETARHHRLQEHVEVSRNLAAVGQILMSRVPLLVYYSSYFTVRPRINLEALADRESRGDLDTEYDFGNLCLLKFLGFTAAELSALAAGPPVRPPNYHSHPPARSDYDAAFDAYRRKLDERDYQLNAASVQLTKDIRTVWGNDQMTLRVKADGQYLKVVVEDSLGVEVELDQRSEGFRWLVSFFVVFRSQSDDQLRGAILLLDEPGLSLHALKQQQFRTTVSLLGEDNQIIYTTHSPFMVGSDELDLVRIVEMTDREEGTKVHTRIQVDDPASLFPLQAALGYDLAQSMFSQKRNLVCEGVTDLFYLEAANQAASEASAPIFGHTPAIVPAGSASRVAYFCTFFTSQNLSVAALLDSDASGTAAAKQDELVALLPRKSILRIGDFIAPKFAGAETEDLFRHTLGRIAAEALGWDSQNKISQQGTRPIMDILNEDHGKSNVSKWRLAKAFVKWLQENSFENLQDGEKAAWGRFVTAVNKAL